MFTKLLKSMLLWNNVCCQIYISIYIWFRTACSTQQKQFFNNSSSKSADSAKGDIDGIMVRGISLKMIDVDALPRCAHWLVLEHVIHARVESTEIFWWGFVLKTTFLQEQILVSRLHLDVAIGPLFENGATSLQQSMKFLFSIILIRSVCGASQEFDFLTWDWN